MSKTVIQTADAPAAIGPYSQAIAAGGMLYVSGQIPLDPVSGALLEGDTAAQARLVLSNLEAILKAGGCTFADVVRSTIFLIDLGDFAAVNAVYSEKFTAPFPARVTIQVAALPRGSKVEIDAIALIPS
ncbi:MAG: RidA family protein [Deltaproteobacteria bacterium]|jgi:2-iminobutanoate/2-iminopropanoate deaminase|nr:RidA family protein [Deltaproteobacteria bacterium]